MDASSSNAVSFQSTPSAWRETYGNGIFTIVCHISIHSLRMEGDGNDRQFSIRHFYFNPLPPHGGRLSCCRSDSLEQAISIHSLRMEGDPIYLVENHKFRIISIHSLRMEGDLRSRYNNTVHFQFQSTPSAWRETFISIFVLPPNFNFNPLPPHGGRRFTNCSAGSAFRISIHSLRMEGDMI